MAVIGSEEVLEAMVVSDPVMASSRPMMGSMMASMITSAFGEGGEVVGEADAIERGLRGVGCKSPLLYLRLDHLGEGRHCRLGSLGRLIEGEDAHATLCRHLHDPAPHGTGADDRDEEIDSRGIKRGKVVCPSGAARPVH